MLNSIALLFLQVITYPLVLALLLRFHMRSQLISFLNPLGQFIFTITDWLVVPLRKLINNNKRWDWLLIALCYLIILLQSALILWLSNYQTTFALLLVWAFFSLLRFVLYLAMFVVLVHVILSWLQPYSWLYSLTQLMCKPWLHGLRKWLPKSTNFDFAPLLFLIIVQILQIVILHLQNDVLDIVI